jgi:hypothetical protein
MNMHQVYEFRIPHMSAIASGVHHIKLQSWHSSYISREAKETLFLQYLAISYAAMDVKFQISN